jgi:Nitrite and sulphite reductase 4Fe-4S domain
VWVQHGADTGWVTLLGVSICLLRLRAFILLTIWTIIVAVQLEERYKSVRAPHKLKGGVSGCVRECAEAQSKDFGLIATDKGWNRTIFSSTFPSGCALSQHHLP